MTAARLAAAALFALPLLGARELVLEDNATLAAFDSDTGAITRLENKATGWRLQGGAPAGAACRIWSPLATAPAAAEVSRRSEHALHFDWRQAGLSADVDLKDGALTFSPTLENQSDQRIAAVDYPCLSDLRAPRPGDRLEARGMRYDNLTSEAIHPGFYPHKAVDSSYSLFCLIQAPREGLYVEMHDPTERYLLQYSFEHGPSQLGFYTRHFIFAAPHAAVALTPVVLHPYRGDWHGGVDLYRQWRRTWYRPAPEPDWVKDVHSWQQLQIGTPEQDWRIRYTELPAYGDACVRHGVAAIQLVGWNHGGQDGGNPYQDTDPGLGTWQELHDAIARIQARGVKIILFGKFTWADLTLPSYRTELRRYASTDPDGIEYETMGDSYLTPTQLAAINNHRFAIMDFLSPAYRAFATREFGKILALGSAGWLYDEVCDRTVGKYNFAGHHGYAPPGYIYAGALAFGRELRAEADRRAGRDFLFAGEGPQDFLTQVYRLSYNRGSKTPVERYLDPRVPMMVAVNGFDDRERLNSILAERTIIEYEPFNFKGRLDEFPLTLAYGEKVDALRKRYRAWLWDADFRDTRGAQVAASGAFRYSVFVNDAGLRTVVVVNEQPKGALHAAVDLPHPRKLVLATPEAPEAAPSTGEFDLPPRSAAVLMEQ